MFVPFTCKSRFCPSCGVNACLKVANQMPSGCLDVKHRHITFTISEKLCPFFQKDRSLLDILFKAASHTILSWFRDKNKSEKFVPGVIATLHTGKRITETIHPFELIKKLIIHIPQKGFNMTRYYSIYAMKKQKSRHLKRIKEKLTKPLKWADKLFKFFNKIPLICSCGNKLKYQYFIKSSSHKFFQLLNPRLI